MILEGYNIETKYTRINSIGGEHEETFQKDCHAFAYGTYGSDNVCVCSGCCKAEPDQGESLSRKNSYTESYRNK